MVETPSGLHSRIINILQDANRLNAVDATGMVGTGREPEFERISGMAGVLFEAPVSQVTFLEDERQWFKSSIGFDAEEAPVETSFCAHTLESSDDVTVILDAREDARFRDNPFVRDEPYIRFYAGCPIIFHGEKVGTLCVYDFKPRKGVTVEQKEFLMKLAVDAASAIYDKLAGHSEAASTSS